MVAEDIVENIQQVFKSIIDVGYKIVSYPFYAFAKLPFYVKWVFYGILLLLILGIILYFIRNRNEFFEVHP